MVSVLVWADESMGSQRYGLYGEWKDSDSCRSGLTSVSSRHLHLLDFMARAKGTGTATPTSDFGEENNLNDIEGFLDRTGALCNLSIIAATCIPQPGHGIPWTDDFYGM